MSNTNAVSPPQRRDFLIAMYNQLMSDINRHIVVVWQSISVVFSVFAAVYISQTQDISFSYMSSVFLIIVIWMLHHIYDAAYWYNRNLVMIANIERQFLQNSDLKDIHYYFGAHRSKSSMLTHLRIQRTLGLSLAVAVLAYHFWTEVISTFDPSSEVALEKFLPYLVSIYGVCKMYAWSKGYQEKYTEFVENSPGTDVDTSGIKYGSGHPAY